VANADRDLAGLYSRHRQGLFTHALAITGCAARAEDAIHDAFARLSRGTSQADRDPVAYVFAAVRSAAIDQFRRSKPGANGKLPDSIFADASIDPASQAIRAEQDRYIVTAVGQLPAEQREIVVLKVYAGLTFAQIAEVTGHPLQTVASRYRRSLEQLRQSLGKLA
jgi:RNA polymerase sigma-70 factor (ECF subfamily)